MNGGVARGQLWVRISSPLLLVHRPNFSSHVKASYHEKGPFLGAARPQVVLSHECRLCRPWRDLNVVLQFNRPRMRGQWKLDPRLLCRG